jgi:hypothetical protein
VRSLISCTSLYSCVFKGDVSFQVENRIFSTLSMKDLLITHISLAHGGPTQHRLFIENELRLIFCTGSTINTMTELTIRPGACNWVFDLEFNGIHKSGKGPQAHWNIWLRLDRDESSYEDLRLERAQIEKEKMDTEAAREEVERQIRDAVRARARASMDRVRESLGMRPRRTQPLELEDVHTTFFPCVFQLFILSFFADLFKRLYTNIF